MGACCVAALHPDSLLIYRCWSQVNADLLPKHSKKDFEKMQQLLDTKLSKKLASFLVHLRWWGGRGRRDFKQSNYFLSCNFHQATWALLKAKCLCLPFLSLWGALCRKLMRVPVSQSTWEAPSRKQCPSSCLASFMWNFGAFVLNCWRILKAPYLLVHERFITHMSMKD